MSSFSSTVLYDFKAVSDLFHNKSDYMDQDLTAELLIHEDEI